MSLKHEHYNQHGPSAHVSRSEFTLKSDYLGPGQFEKFLVCEQKHEQRSKLKCGKQGKHIARLPIAATQGQFVVYISNLQKIRHRFGGLFVYICR